QHSLHPPAILHHEAPGRPGGFLRQYPQQPPLPQAQEQYRVTVVVDAYFPSPVAKQWERVPEGRVRALCLSKEYSLRDGRLRERALIRPPATFSHAARG